MNAITYASVAITTPQHAVRETNCSEYNWEDCKQLGHIDSDLARLYVLKNI